MEENSVSSFQCNTNAVKRKWLDTKPESKEVLPLIERMSLVPGGSQSTTKLFKIYHMLWQMEQIKS